MPDRLEQKLAKHLERELFRVFLEGGDTLDVDARNPDEAREVAKKQGRGNVRKVKRVRA